MASEAMSTEAEALKNALIRGHVSVFRTSQKRNEAIAGIARTIVKKLGITEKHVGFLDSLWSITLHDDDHDAVEEIRGALSTLLELAGEE